MANAFLPTNFSDLAMSLISISIIFVVWKGVILFVAWLAPGQGYDTSTNLLAGANRLVRWDAIYFVQKARRGDIFEQEWAFGKGLSTLLSSIAEQDLSAIATTGILVSHIAHYLSVILLWRIAGLLGQENGKSNNTRSTPYIAACLHIISPAGIFLSAPYAEAPFSCLNMLGFWLYLQAHSNTESSTTRKCCALIMSGMSFGGATMMRSNGILSGIPFLIDALRSSLVALKDLREGRVNWSRVLALLATMVAGLATAAGLALPQYLAYQEYCNRSGDVRSWCYSRLPLIYSFVQSHYWGVGFLRYWSLSNVPLFLLAIPILLLLLWSGIESFTGDCVGGSSTRQIALVRRLVLPQMVLAILVITNYHVQIITRLASGYPWVYMWLAERVVMDKKEAKLSVRFFVIYGLIQAGLFASFLPPA
ncbi:ER membrane glycoprotein subunit of the GPI transamidase complex-like protein [Exophiala xenobiotica]|uniref:GPI mannosyltransferase 2 n=1 Tax=Lithohypha guttulata TaxID=1690604 RepID=A0ABR0KPH3_9EURO|nr:ER membrane glycoprotein subunit of the GPI transamidase complex-like protein [Lithohypha guttulata]KAK5330794.1 ER membrane glycoprotein subunit of the GPI transamidase complex-like protein [Exophiala xenobiotica]